MIRVQKVTRRPAVCWIDDTDTMRCANGHSVVNDNVLCPIRLSFCYHTISVHVNVKYFSLSCMNQRKGLCYFDGTCDDLE